DDEHVRRYREWDAGDGYEGERPHRAALQSADCRPSERVPGQQTVAELQILLAQVDERIDLRSSLDGRGLDDLRVVELKAPCIGELQERCRPLDSGPECGRGDGVPRFLQRRLQEFRSCVSDSPCRRA